jgi:hypothetical protein
MRIPIFLGKTGVTRAAKNNTGPKTTECLGTAAQQKLVAALLSPMEKENRNRYSRNNENCNGVSQISDQVRLYNIYHYITYCYSSMKMTKFNVIAL